MLGYISIVNISLLLNLYIFSYKIYARLFTWNILTYLLLHYPAQTNKYKYFIIYISTYDTLQYLISHNVNQIYWYNNIFNSLRVYTYEFNCYKIKRQSRPNINDIYLITCRIKHILQISECLLHTNTYIFSLRIKHTNSHSTQQYSLLACAAYTLKHKYSVYYLYYSNYILKSNEICSLMCMYCYTNIVLLISHKIIHRILCSHFNGKDKLHTLYYTIMLPICYILVVYYLNTEQIYYVFQVDRLYNLKIIKIR